MSSAHRSVSHTPGRFSRPVLTAIILGIFALVTSVWLVSSHREVESLEREIAQLRSSANASVFDLVPTDFAPNNAQGHVFIRLSGSGAVIVSNLPQPGDNESFVLWYVPDDGSAVSGGTLDVNEFGVGFALIPGDTDGYSQIAISLDNADTDTPGGNYLLIADVKPGRG